MTRVLLLACALVGVAALGVAFPSASQTEPQATYVTGTGPGSYTVTVERFKRHGPETPAVGPFQLENLTQVVRYRINESAGITDVSMTISSDEGNFRLDLNDGQYVITDLDSNTQSPGPTIPQGSLSLPAQPEGHESLTSALESAGMTRVEESATWRSRHVAVYEDFGSIVGQLNMPGEGEPLGLPVMYDLSPVTQRAGVYVDTETDIAVYGYRYAVDAGGNETLIESFAITSIERED